MDYPDYHRPLIGPLLERLEEPRRFMQVLAGPRQVGKTTLARQAMEQVPLPNHYASADQPSGQDRAWLEAQWAIGRELASGSPEGALLVLDEAQKISEWSEVVKRLWDEDTSEGRPLKVVLLGSSPLLVQRGLTESLAGRFEVIRVPHWSYPEMREAFDFDLDRFLFFGGYPGAAALTDDHERWISYILDSLVETTIARDVLLLTRIEKPALLRQLFRLACDYSGQVLSFTKMLGQLQDAGNTVTLAHYLELLAGAGLVIGLQKYSGSRLRQRGSSPKLIALNTALMSVFSGLTFQEAKQDRPFWGRLTETAVGAHLINSAPVGMEVFYWRERGKEVDFVVRSGRKTAAFEVTTSERKGQTAGLDAFSKEFRPKTTYIVGGQGIPLDDFLSSEPARWPTA